MLDRKEEPTCQENQFPLYWWLLSQKIHEQLHNKPDHNGLSQDSEKVSFPPDVDLQTLYEMQTVIQIDHRHHQAGRAARKVIVLLVKGDGELERGLEFRDHTNQEGGCITAISL